MINSLEKLINGNDIRGVALEGVEGEKVNLTPEVVEILGVAFAKWLATKKHTKTEDLKISVGRDSRLSGENLKTSLIHGITSSGAEVYDCGLASTPAMFMTTVLEEYRYHGAIMLTASHLPFNRNGMKFFTNKGAIEKADLKEVVAIAKEIKEIAKVKEERVNTIDFISQYSKFLVEKIRNGVNSKINREEPLKGFKIIVDAGNGAGGFFVDKVLKPLGADTQGSQFIDPDGRFPNHIPNPEDKEAMHSIQKAVLGNKADLGIIFDTDVDRAAVVDSHGNEINRNKLIALISAIILEENPKTTVVTDSVTSEGLKDFIENKCGGKHHRFKRGYKNVINEALRLNNEGEECHIAIETSGHAALKENYFLDDGAYLVSKILVKTAKLKEEKDEDIHNLIKDLKEASISSEYRMKITCEEFKEYGNKILEDLKKYCEKREGWEFEVPNYEGVRVKCNKENGGGWFLVRLSLHDPVIPMNVETDSKEGEELIVRELYKFFSGYENLNIDSLNK
ncbi:phosphomannomutase/phosphoglucomutase [Haloimpatiens massiliensis]|uniref:phosphomannomutase/phosphoglucomutase n=1 Tax=Haloimpatiens massiliensis TaxID=1658110 RepID=UPI000C8173CD|nr:phosphomannomutase/phosphoglucomutase [Haloimpatiens massiliensis]